MPNFVTGYVLQVNHTAVSTPTEEFKEKQAARLKKDLDLLYGPDSYQLEVLEVVVRDSD